MLVGDPKRFWDRVAKDSSGCWIWLGRKYRDGYGDHSYYVDSRLHHIAAHRAAWALANGRLPLDGMQICHKCDNPPCVNPAHLFEGSPADNVHDMIAKGRAVLPPSRLGTASLRVLTDADVVEIRRRAASGQTFTAIALALGVGITTVRDAAHGATWGTGGFVVPNRRPGRRPGPVPTVDMRCGRCGTTKPINDFAPSFVKRKGGWCRPCLNAYNRDRLRRLAARENGS